MLAYFGHHKCGTQWISSIVKQVCAAADLTVSHHDSAAAFEGDIVLYRQRFPFDFWCYTNADYFLVRGVKLSGFHVVRDPRDVIVSGYFSHLNSHPLTGWPQLRSYREMLQSLSRDDGMLREMEFSGPILYSMLHWAQSISGVREVQFEDLIQGPEDKFSVIFKELGVVPNRISEQELRAIVSRNAFQRLSGGREAGQENSAHHYRKGVPGDWRNHFKPQHVDYFKRLFNPILLKLGYETKEDWY